MRTYTNLILNEGKQMPKKVSIYRKNSHLRAKTRRMEAFLQTEHEFHACTEEYLSKRTKERLKSRGVKGK